VYSLFTLEIGGRMAFHRSTDIREEFDLEMSAAAAFGLVVSAYRAVGQVKSVQEVFMRVDGKIGGGIGGMNLASVTVQVKKVGDSASKLVIDAAAKEGLINQGTASSAVSRLLEAMN
jgi:hypothetical protein